MPDPEGKTKGPGTKTPDQAYKDGRSEDVQEGSLGADTGGADTQKSRLPEGRDEKGSFQSGGFGGQQAEDAPDAGTVGSISGEGDPSPHAGHADNDTPDASADDIKTMADNQSPPPQEGDAVDSQGYGQHGDKDATDPAQRQAHPKTPSDMGNR
jgi:hypothetical protein